MKLAYNAVLGLLLTLAECRGNTNSGLQVSLNKLQHEVKAGIDKSELDQKLNRLDFYEHSSTSYSKWQPETKMTGESMPFEYIPNDVSLFRVIVYSLDGKPSITGYRLHKTAYILFEKNTSREMVFE
ncbi:hypothetical protein CCB80_01710 [Armatimonadetes bacterium Uphvl-Ar1]|nr:hypothetical protein CCB80_01710 [Armatimonadetes bacterium Uphvl-Ar1]